MQSPYDAAMATVPSGVQKAVTILDNISIIVGKFGAWFCVPMIFCLVWEVFMRYVFVAPTIWASDLTVQLFGAMYMLASPYCLRDGGHVRTDFFYHNWSVRTRALSDLLHYILLFFPAHIVFLQVGWAYFMKSFLANEVSPLSGWMPIIWPAKFCIPFYVAITMTQGISEVIKCIYRIKTKVDLWHPEVEELASIDISEEAKAEKA